MNIVKGTRIKASWYKLLPSSLAGMQPKVGAKAQSVTVTVRHIRAESAESDDIMLLVEPGDPEGDFSWSTGDCTCHLGLSEFARTG